MVGKFNILSPDQVIEQTIDEQQKGSGGIIGYSTSIGTVQRRIISSHAVAEILKNFTDVLMFGQKLKDLSTSRKYFDEEIVVYCKDLISEWNSPIKQRKELVSLSSGLIPTEKAKEDILQAYRIRKLGFKRFVEEIIFSHTISFYDQ